VKIEYIPYTPKQVRILAKTYGLKVKWYEYILNNMLRKRLLKYITGE